MNANTLFSTDRVCNSSTTGLYHRGVIQLARQLATWKKQAQTF